VPYSHGNQLRISVFGSFDGRVEKQEMWMAKKVTESLPCQDIIKKAWEQKPNSYIIFKELLKSYATDQVLSLSLSQTQMQTYTLNQFRSLHISKG
jgi:hypothetical protein